MEEVFDNTNEIDSSIDEIIERANKSFESQQQKNIDKNKKNIINKIEDKKNTFQSLDQEKLNTNIQDIIDNALKNIKVGEVKKDIVPGIKKANPINVKLPNDIQSYIITLPDKDKDKVLRYVDIFRDDPSPVIEYVNDLKKFGSEAEAKKQGSTARLMNPYNVDWIKKQDKEIDEDTKRFLRYSLHGSDIYDISDRSDAIGEQKQTEFYNRKLVKIVRGPLLEAQSAARGIAKTGAAIVDLVPYLNTDLVNYIEAHWDEVPRTREGLEKFSGDIAEFGISYVTGKKLLQGLGFFSNKAAPGITKKIVQTFTPAKKNTADKLVSTSDIAQKAGYWGKATEMGKYFVEGGIAYGVGSVLTRDDERDRTILGDNFDLLDATKITETKGLVGREKAAETLKNKLKFGAEGTALMGGLTVAGRYVAMPVLKTANNVVIKPTLNFVGDTVFNPIAKFAAKEKIMLPLASGFGFVEIPGIPTVARGIKTLTDKVLPDPTNWKLYSTTSGPIKERIQALADKYILTPLRTAGKNTPEGRAIFMEGEQLVAKYRKSVDLDLNEIERGLYKTLNISFKDRLFKTATPVAAKEYLESFLSYLKGEVNVNTLPKIMHEPAKRIRSTIDELSLKIRPYLTGNEDLEKAFLDNIGKYVRNSYEIFRGRFTPNEQYKKAAEEYFKSLITKQNPIYKDTKRADELKRLASQRVEQIIQVGTEGTTPAERLQAITKLSTPISNLIAKKNIPEVIQKLLGKVEDPRTIVLDTVANQAQLLSHFTTHKRFLEYGLQNKLIFKSPEEFAKLGIQQSAARALVPIKVAKNNLNIDLTDVYTYGVGKGDKRLPYYTTPELAAAISGDNLITDALLKIPGVKLLLAVKTASQIAPTALSLSTQLRNFGTGPLFSSFRGHIGRNASVIDSINVVFQGIFGRGKVDPVVLRKKLLEYADYGVTEGTVFTKEIELILKDVTSNKFTSTDKFYEYLFKNPLFNKPLEIYQGSDHVFKIFGYEFTKSQLVPAIPKNGIKINDAKRLGYTISAERETLKTPLTWQELVDKQYKEIFNKNWSPKKITGELKTHAEAINEIASEYVKNVYPNYGMVPKLVQNWRRLPYGNFIGFQSEMIRNIYQGLSFAVREMGSSNPFVREMGARAMLGMGTTMYGMGKAISSISSTLTDMDEEFIKKYQRFFSPWYAKNSTWYPVSKMDPVTKKFFVLDWTSELPYSSGVDAFDAFSRAIFDPVKTDEAFYKRFYKAMFYDVDEEKDGALLTILKPFVEKSILTQALVDVTTNSTKDGVRLYDPRNTSYDEKIGIIAGRLFETINPSTFKQAGQLAGAIDQEIDKAGKRYNTTEKVLKLFFGLAIREEDPRASLPYVIGKLSKRIEEADSYFTKKVTDPRELLNNPSLIVEEFNALQKNRYREMSRVKDFLEVSNQLFTREELMKEFRGRQEFGQVVINGINNGTYRATNIPDTSVSSLFPKILQRLQRAYPNKNLELEDIFPRDQLIEIREKWNGVPLDLTDDELDAYFRGKQIEPKETEYKEEFEYENKGIDSILNTISKIQNRFKNNEKIKELLPKIPLRTEGKIQTPPLPKTPEPVTQQASVNLTNVPKETLDKYNLLFGKIV